MIHSISSTPFCDHEHVEHVIQKSKDHVEDVDMHAQRLWNKTHAICVRRNYLRHLVESNPVN